MPMERIETTRRLRQLIRMQRTNGPGALTQKAAAELAGLSEVHWRHIETGHADVATAETLARMCHAVGVTADQLRKIGMGHLADLVGDRDELLGPAEDLETYLMKAPGLTDAQRAALVVMAKAFS